MTNVIADTTIIGVRPDGSRIEIRFSIGAPYLDSAGEHWRCPVSLKPLYNRLADAAGIDAIQSVCLALSLAFDLLGKFKEDGGQLLHDDGTEFPLGAYSFGHPLRSSDGA